MQFSKVTICALSIWVAGATAESVSPEAFLHAIRANDLKSLQELSKSGVTSVRDKLEWTPLHYAAIYGSAESVRIVLSAGGDPNAVNRSKITPLIMAAYDLPKTKLLVEKGADVNAMASDGSTPLWVALGAHDNDATVRYLVEHGADVKAARQSRADAITRAAQHATPATLRLLLEKGANPNTVTKQGNSAVDLAVGPASLEKVRLLTAKGAPVNVRVTDAGLVRNGPIELTGVTSLMDAASWGEPGTLAVLLKAGANLNEQDDRKMTALMRAAASERNSEANVRELLAAGADAHLADWNGETALDWARKYGNPEVIRMLEKAGAREKGLAKAPVPPADYRPDARVAVERSSALLAKSAEVFFREGGGCMGCHHQPFAAKAFAAVRDAGGVAEPRLRQILVNGVPAERARELNRQVVLTLGGGGIDGFLYMVSALGDLGEPASDVTDVMVHMIAESQDPSGGWELGGDRPPLQESDITRAALAIQALKQYSWPARQAEFSERIARARNWLRAAKPVTNLEEIERLRGLWLAGEPEAEVRKMGTKILAMQRADGGWAQTKHLESDAYGTGAALYTLRKVGILKASDAAYQKGAKYLLSTQFPDGSWYVRSRAVKLQPYFQSAFPFEHDQWISNSGTAYAVMALAPLAGK